MIWIIYQQLIFDIREASIETIIYFGVSIFFFFFKEKVYREMTRRYWNINLEEMIKARVLRS